MPIDSTYQLTRRRGSPGVVTRVTDTTADPETGDRDDNTVDTKVRWLVRLDITYTRLIRAQATQQRIGDTDFVIWFPDVKNVFTELTQEDHITYQGKRYEVVSSKAEDTAFLINAREMAR